MSSLQPAVGVLPSLCPVLNPVGFGIEKNHGSFFQLEAIPPSASLEGNGCRYLLCFTFHISLFPYFIYFIFHDKPATVWYAPSDIYEPSPSDHEPGSCGGLGPNSGPPKPGRNGHPNRRHPVFVSLFNSFCHSTKEKGANSGPPLEGRSCEPIDGQVAHYWGVRQFSLPVLLPGVSASCGKLALWLFLAFFLLSLDSFYSSDNRPVGRT